MADGFYDDMDTSNMDQPDWQGTDVSSAPAWSNQQLSSGDMSGVGSDYTSQWDNVPQGTGALDWQSLVGRQSYAPDSAIGRMLPEQAGQQPVSFDSGQNFSGGIQNTLQNIFSGLGTQGGKGALTGLGALVEGMQNKRKAGAVQGLVQQQQQRLDPFGSQRGYYQQQLQNTTQNPYQQPIVAAQVQQLQRAQAMKDAAAGRRSNNATSSPALLAAQAQVAQQYMNSLMQPAGAGITPTSAGLSELLAGQNSGINGYISPLMSAGGYLAGTATNSAQMNNRGTTQYTPEEMAAIIKYTQGNK